jgi:phenylacetate-CoA ligase
LRRFVLFSLRHLWALLRGRGKLAAIFVIGGHFLGNTMMARRLRTMPWRARTQQIFSALSSISELVRELNAFQPVMLGGYPSALEVLAREQLAGRLHIHPVLINTALNAICASMNWPLA